MAASVSGSKTVTQTLAPHLKNTYLTNLMAIAPENFLVSQIADLQDALSRVSGGAAPNATVGSLLR